ncbi:MAG: hypothetical protein WBC97_01600 [Gemmatimonadales bacterium]
MIDHTDKPRLLARRLGIAGLLFFLLKGIFWLSVPLLLAMKGCHR